MQARAEGELERFYASLAATGLVHRLVELARDEDLGVPSEGGEGLSWTGDLTTAACIDGRQRARAHVVARREGVVAGLACVPTVVEVFGGRVSVRFKARDGDRVKAGSVLALLDGPLAEILELERTLLNLVGRLSGVATQTARHVAVIPQGSRTKVYDTRKTTPGLRVLEKYAVRCGGGASHRLGLHDAVLIKDNHLAGVSDAELGAFVAAAAAKARAMARPSFVEVEVDRLEQLDALLTLPPGVVNIVLLDNMGPEKLREACARRDRAQPRLELEASGGITLETLGEVAKVGVDRVSLGALTHSAVSLDVALDIDEGMARGARAEAR